MFTNRRPYHGLKMSTTDFFREPVRYLKESNTQESMMEKPYLEDEYPKMHLKLPDFKFKPREIPSIFGPIANGDPYPGLAILDFGDARCGWNTTDAPDCIEGPILISMKADYLFHAEFEFVAEIASNSAAAWLTKLGATQALGWDEQRYLLTFPKNSKGSVTVCGFASTHTLISQTFKTVVAGMPVGIHLVGGALIPIERGQDKPATLLKSVYGDKGSDCGCIALESNCTGGCSAPIGYTTQQMGLGETQTLTVVDSIEGCSYSWSLVQGGGVITPPSGTEVEYQAPSENTNCDLNPKIELSVNGEVYDVLYIAVTNTTTPGNAYLNYSAGVTCVGGYCKKYVTTHNCVDAGGSPHFQSCIPDGWITCSDNDGCGGCFTENYDIRTEAMIEAGCCPAGLM